MKNKNLFLLACIACFFQMTFAQDPSGTCGTNLNWVFNSQTGTLTITGSGKMDNYYNGTQTPWSGLTGQITSVSLPSGLTSIGDNAFAGCSITEITIPNTVKRIGDYAFYVCSDLAIVNLGNVQSIGTRAFYQAYALEHITFPASLDTIWYEAFAYSALKEVTLPKTLEDIDLGVFEHCSHLESAVILAPLTKIPGHLFYLCSALKSVQLPDGLKTIADNAFYECTSLESVTIPSTVTVMDESFNECSGLQTITCKAVNPPTGHNRVFYNVPKDIPVYVPAGSVSAYRDHNKWGEFTNIQPIGGEPIVWQVTIVQPENGTIYVVEDIDLDAVPDNTELHFIATPAAGYEFGAWMGCNTDGSLVVKEDVSVSCTFKKTVVPADDELLFVRVKDEPTDWTGQYIITFNDMLPHSLVASNNKDFIAAQGAEQLIDINDTIHVGATFADFITITTSEGAYSLQLPDDKYIQIPGSNAVSTSDTPVGLYLHYVSNADKEGVAVANSADITASDTRIIYQNGEYFRAYTNKLTGNPNYLLPKFYRLTTDSVQTGIADTQSNQNNGKKMLIDGVLYIITPNGTMYNAQGVLVK